MITYNKSQKGFTLIELIVAVGIFVIIIGIPYAYFTRQLKHTVKESAISQSALEKIPSVEILRKDIEDAGYGLAWDTTGITYEEAKSASLDFYSLDPASFNDAPNPSDTNNHPPRAILGKVDNSSNGFSYLVLKGTSLGLNKACGHWSYIDRNGNLNIWPINNSANYNNLQNGDRVIVMDAVDRSIIKNSNKFYFTVSKDATQADTNPADYNLPTPPQSTYLIYGVDTSDLGAPFNRVDYRLYKGSDNESECAVGTHTLGRAVMRQSDGVMYSYPLLHCVADFQVGFGLDTDKDGKIDKWIQDITGLSATDIRNQLKQVRVYILVQNGTKDRNYDYPDNSIYVGDSSIGIGRDFDLTQITDYKHYRWKLIKLVVEPKNLGVSK